MFHLLGASDSDPIKVIFTIIVFVLWIVGGLATSASKKRDKERRDRIRESIERERNIQTQLPPQIPLPTIFQQPTPSAQIRVKRTQPPAPRPTQRQTKTRKLPPIPKLAKVPLPPLPLPSASETPAPKGTLPIQATAISSQPAPTPTTRAAQATAATLRVWMRPSTMRQQFILTEIFQPPLSLREPKEMP